MADQPRYETISADAVATVIGAAAAAVRGDADDYARLLDLDEADGLDEQQLLDAAVAVVAGMARTWVGGADAGRVLRLFALLVAEHRGSG